MKTLLIILLTLPLVSVAPAPPQLDRAIVARPILSSVVTPRVQACDEATARQFGTVLRQIVLDPKGVPYGEVKAWSCGADASGAIAELQTRQSALEAEAAAYRQAHPLH
jgi:hypothetical protein